MKAIVVATLRTLGITSCYRGFPPVVYSILLVINDESRLDNAMRDIYSPTALALDLDMRNVERNIRTIIQRAWQVDKARLSDIAGYRLDGPPSALQFIEIMASYIRRSI